MLNLELFLKELKDIVNIDSGTYDIAGVNKVQDWFEEKFVKELGYIPTKYDVAPEKLGRSMLYSKSNDHNFDLLIISHVDTVFPKGEVAERPFSIDGDEIKGPGTADMKGGCLFTWYSMQQLVAEKSKIGNIGLFFNGEHEIGCPNTRPIMEELIKKSRIVIATECTRGNGAYVKRRKGILRFTMKFEGVAAHSGNNPEDGQCAVLEMANWIVALKKLADPARGISINTGMANGGTSVNTIPDAAELRIDVRVCELTEAAEMESKIRAIKPFNDKVKVTVTGGITRPPMVPNDKTEVLCKIVEELGKKNNIEVKWASVGGGSDASYASPFGKPVLCGLTPKGKGGHTKNEIIYIHDLKERFANFKDIVKSFSLLTDKDLESK